MFTTSACSYGYMFVRKYDAFRGYFCKKVKDYKTEKKRKISKRHENVNCRRKENSGSKIATIGGGSDCKHLFRRDEWENFHYAYWRDIKYLDNYYFATLLHMHAILLLRVPQWFNTFSDDFLNERINTTQLCCHK